MYEILSKKKLNDTVTQMDVFAPLVSKKAEPGQFIILRVDRDGERIPLTISDTDPEKGSVRIVFGIVGKTTAMLDKKEQGDCLQDFVGPLGEPTKLDGIKKACVVGGGVGSAIALPIAKKLKQTGAEVDVILGFRTRDLVILEDEFSLYSDSLQIMTDDGTYGQKGVVTDSLAEKLDSGKVYDEVFAIGPLIMMKYVVETTRPKNVKTTVSMNPIMIDGTGMCGGCRLLFDGKPKFACVDGPDFDGFSVDFDSLMQRNATYRDFESAKREHECNLFKKGE